MKMLTVVFITVDGTRTYWEFREENVDLEELKKCFKSGLRFSNGVFGIDMAHVLQYYIKG